MLFSIIIPFYNRASLIDEVLESVANQELKDYELIAVDDGSTDDTLEKLKAHPHIDHVVAIPNSGPAVARNAGAKQASGQYLAFLDSDDLWFPYTLALYKSVIDEHNLPSVITSKPLIFQNSGDIRVPDSGPVSILDFPCYNKSYRDRYWFGVSSFLIRADAFFEVGGFVDRRMNAEDADLMLKLGTSPGFIHISHPPPFAYRRHASNLTDNHSLNLVGLDHLALTELNGGYPGGGSHAAMRRVIITRHVRPMVIAGIRSGFAREVWPLFRKTLAWNLKQGRVRYLAFCLFGFIRSILH